MNGLKSQKIAGHYLVEEKIGQGGMGEIYLALDERLERYVAIKKLNLNHENQKDREHAVKCFHQEARAVAKLNHPHIVSIYDIANEGQEFYMVMEYVKGYNLQEILKKQSKGLSVKLTHKWGVQLCEALKQAHAHGIIHRDVKPANILVSEHQDVKLTDFGIAQLQKKERLSANQNAVMMGSFLYAAPEQLVNASDIDVRSDIYALGATLYELLTGRPVYLANNVADLIRKVFMETPISPQSLNAQIPDSLDKLILRCLGKDPEERYQNMSELLQDFELLEGFNQHKKKYTLIDSDSSGQKEPDTRNGPLHLNILKNTTQGGSQTISKVLKKSDVWLRQFLETVQGIKITQNFEEVKKQLFQTDVDGNKFSGILSFQECFVFVKNGMICGALNSSRDKINDEALKTLSHQSPVLWSHRFPEDLIKILSSLLSDSGLAIQEELDSRLVNLFPIIEDLHSELEAFTGYVLCQRPGQQVVFIYYQSQLYLSFCIHDEQDIEIQEQSLRELVESESCSLSIFMPGDHMLNTVVYDFFKLAQLVPEYDDEGDTNLTSLLSFEENNVSDWMRNTLYDSLRQNLRLRILDHDHNPFPGAIQEILQKRQEFQMAKWLMSELFISLHSHGQKLHFQNVYPCFAEINRLCFYETLTTQSGHSLTTTLGAYVSNQEFPTIICLFGNEDPEELEHLLSFSQTFNDETDSLTSIVYFSENVLSPLSTALFSKNAEKIGLFNKQKGYIKAKKGKTGFHLFLVELHNENVRLIAPSLV